MIYYLLETECLMSFHKSKLIKLNDRHEEFLGRVESTSNISTLYADLDTERKER